VTPTFAAAAVLRWIVILLVEQTTARTQRPDALPASVAMAKLAAGP
jgi:hypothetical protein